jgi:DNA replication protein DnaC
MPHCCCRWGVERPERRAWVLTTHLPFGEWTAVFPEPRLGRAVIDRLPQRAHSIATGLQSIRLQEALRRHPSTAPSEG